MLGNPARMRRRWHAAPLLAASVALAGCDLTLGYDRDIEGFYDYAGTVRYSPGYAVVGEIYIDQRSSRP